MKINTTYRLLALIRSSLRQLKWLHYHRVHCLLGYYVHIQVYPVAAREEYLRLGTQALMHRSDPKKLAQTINKRLELGNKYHL